MKSTRAWALALLILTSASIALPQYTRRRIGSTANPGAIGAEPLASFTGSVQELDKKILRIKTEETNTLQFVCDRKTQYFDGDKKIKLDGIKPGDRVLVESKRFRDGELEAINVRLQHAKTENAGEPKS